MIELIYTYLVGVGDDRPWCSWP